MWSWSGFYVGAHAGYGWANDPTQVMAQPDTFGPGLIPTMMGGVNSRGYIAGFQAGANWQSGAFVGGLEIDLSKTEIKGSASASGLDNNIPPDPVTGTLSDKIDLLGSARARLVIWFGRTCCFMAPAAWPGRVSSRLQQRRDDLCLQPDDADLACRVGRRCGRPIAALEQQLARPAGVSALRFWQFHGTSQGFIDPNEPTGINFRNIVTGGRLTTDVVRAGIDYKFDSDGFWFSVPAQLRAQLTLLDGAVAATNHLVGDQFTLADIYLLPMLHYLKLLPESGAMLTPSTALGRYHETHAARPSYVRTIPPLAPPRRATPAA